MEISRSAPTDGVGTGCQYRHSLKREHAGGGEMRCDAVRNFCFQLGVLGLAATALAQESEPDNDAPGARANETAEQRETLEQCATMPGAIDIAVLDDRHVYIRTRGSNHYLLTTEQCDRLYTAYLREQVRLVPYGREVCRNDGSYLLYIDGGRPKTCYIEHVQRVDDRAAARELAAGRSPEVRFEPVEIEPPPESEQSVSEPEPPRASGPEASGLESR